MTLHHDDIDGRFKRLAPKNIDQHARFRAICLNPGQIMKTLGGTIVDETSLRPFNLDDITERCECLLGQRLYRQRLNLQLCLPQIRTGG